MLYDRKKEILHRLTFKIDTLPRVKLKTHYRVNFLYSHYRASLHCSGRFPMTVVVVYITGRFPMTVVVVYIILTSTRKVKLTHI